MVLYVLSVFPCRKICRPLFIGQAFGLTSHATWFSVHGAEAFVHCRFYVQFKPLFQKKVEDWVGSSPSAKQLVVTCSKFQITHSFCHDFHEIPICKSRSFNLKSSTSWITGSTAKPSAGKNHSLAHFFMTLLMIYSTCQGMTFHGKNSTSPARQVLDEVDGICFQPKRFGFLAKIYILNNNKMHSPS